MAASVTASTPEEVKAKLVEAGALGKRSVQIKDVIWIAAPGEGGVSAGVLRCAPFMARWMIVSWDWDQFLGQTIKEKHVAGMQWRESVAELDATLVPSVEMQLAMAEADAAGEVEVAGDPTKSWRDELDEKPGEAVWSFNDKFFFVSLVPHEKYRMVTGSGRVQELKVRHVWPQFNVNKMTVEGGKFMTVAEVEATCAEAHKELAKKDYETQVAGPKFDLLDAAEAKSHVLFTKGSKFYFYVVRVEDDRYYYQCTNPSGGSRTSSPKNPRPDMMQMLKSNCGEEAVEAATLIAVADVPDDNVRASLERL